MRRRPSRPNHRAVRGALLAWVCCPVLASCSQEAGGAGQDLGTASQTIQYDYVGRSQTATGKGVHLVTSWGSTKKAKSVGAIRPWAGGEWPGTGGKWTCGATFISPHYAVTAAHCVQMIDLPTLSSVFAVQQINIQNLNLTEYDDQAVVSGSWPNYTRADPVNSKQGYSVYSTPCYVRRRCHKNESDYNEPLFGRDNCPFDEFVDVALIVCPYRSRTDYVTVAASSPTQTHSVEVWWFHEVVKLMTSVGSAPPGQPILNYTHYYQLNSQESNWHYHSPAQNHQLFPLRSYRDAAGRSFRTLETESGNTHSVVDTNIQACHGMSGSGIFIAGSASETNPKLLGPAANSGSYALGSGGGLLCDNLNTAPASDFVGIKYVSSVYVRQLEAVSEVQDDR